MENPNIQFDEIIHLMNEWVIVDDANGHILYANQTFCSIIGADPKTIQGRKSIEFWDEKSIKKIQEVDATIRKKGKSSTYECTLVSQSGEKIPVLVSGAPRKNGGSVGIITDLSKIKEQETKLTQFSKAISRSSDAHILLDNNGSILLWNKWAEHIFGIGEKEAKKQNIQDISNGMITFSEKQPYTSHEVQLHIDETKTIWIAYTIEKTDQNEDMYLCIVRDISHTKKLQQHLEERYNKMQSAINEFGIMRRKMDYFYDLHKATQNCKSIKDFGQFVASSIHMISGAHSCMIHIQKGNYLKILATYGLDRDWWWQKSIKIDSKPIQSIFNAKVVKIFDIENSPHVTSKKLLQKNQITSMIIFALEFRWENIGMISIHLDDADQWNIFEDEYLIDYIHAIEICLGSLLLQKGNSPTT